MAFKFMIRFDVGDEDGLMLSPHWNEVFTGPFKGIVRLKTALKTYYVDAKLIKKEKAVFLFGDTWRTCVMETVVQPFTRLLFMEEKQEYCLQMVTFDIYGVQRFTVRGIYEGVRLNIQIVDDEKRDFMGLHADYLNKIGGLVGDKVTLYTRLGIWNVDFGLGDDGETLGFRGQEWLDFYKANMTTGNQQLVLTYEGGNKFQVWHFHVDSGLETEVKHEDEEGICFWKKIENHVLKSQRLTIPAEFASQQHLDVKRRAVIVYNDSEFEMMVFVVNDSRLKGGKNTRHVQLRGNWKEFVKMHKIRVGKDCKFSMDHVRCSGVSVVFKIE